ncbi:MAG: hypothetical protein JWQ03_1716 [Variovorax sp.]|nr:hypothetical protein [Variovorax sp.]
MLNVRQILVSAPAGALGCAAVAALLTGCGQAGALYLPTEPAAANRATLPQTLIPALPERDKAASSPSPAAPGAQR